MREATARGGACWPALARNATACKRAEMYGLANVPLGSGPHTRRIASGAWDLPFRIGVANILQA